MVGVAHALNMSYLQDMDTTSTYRTATTRDGITVRTDGITSPRGNVRVYRADRDGFGWDVPADSLTYADTTPRVRTRPIIVLNWIEGDELGMLEVTARRTTTGQMHLTAVATSSVGGDTERVDLGMWWPCDVESRSGLVAGRCGCKWCRA